MGEVYRAADTKLGREVALKVLPAEFAADADRLARFEREARVLASLNHPGIAHLYGFEHVGDPSSRSPTHFLVMELVEGEDLAERLKRGALGVDEAVTIATRVAEALEEAHEKGIVHRDLKPANVKLTPDGRVKVLDFGLAKAWSGDAGVLSGTGGLSQSPTLARTGTEAGLILGTAAYMAPEQARGKAVDKRADIWAFGVVLFELLTGRKLFDGETVTDVLAAVVRQEIDWSVLPVGTPAAVRRLLARCLDRDPRKRLRDVGEARLALEEAARADETLPPIPGAAPVATSGGVRPPAWSLALALAAVAVAAFWAGRSARPGPTATPVSHLELGLAPAEKLGPPDRMQRPWRHAFALTPDGRRLVFAGERGGATQLYVRPLDAREAAPLAGTEGADTPFLSPDGQWVAFLAEGQIRKVPIDGGPVETIAGIAAGDRSVSPLVRAKEDLFGASWGEGDVIVFGRYNDGLWRVSARGGTPARLTTLAPGETAHRLPRVLPGGKAVLFRARGALAVAPIEGGAHRVVLEPAGDARYSPTGHLVFVRDAILMAAPFDLRSLSVTGPSVALLDDVLVATGSRRPSLDTGAAQFDLARDGTLAYATGGVYPDEPTRLAWVDRAGRVEPLAAPTGNYSRPRLSPDGRRVAAAYTSQEASDAGGLAVLDLARGSFGRLPGESSWGPVWSADGSEVLFGGRTPLGRVAADGSRKPEPLGVSFQAQASSVSPDGSLLATLRNSAQTGTDIWIVPLAGGEPRPWLETSANEAWAEFSPDGKWMAYGSDVSGRNEVYVRPFPGPGSPYQVSVDGGYSPIWARSGRELFFVTRVEGVLHVLAADVATSPSFSAGRPRLLFKGRFGTLGGPTGYDVSADGRRFLMVEDLGAPAQPATRLRVVLGWPEELRRTATRTEARPAP
jgi:serine/threonine-protein kinase